MLDGEPLSPPDARRLIRRTLAEGSISYSVPHAQIEMRRDGIEITDIANVLRGGMPREPEFENGAYRYKVETQRFCVVVEFIQEDELMIVTAWRFKR